MQTTGTAGLDAHDAQILAALVPEGAEPGTPPEFGLTADTAAAPAAAPAAATPAPAAPAPAASLEQVAAAPAQAIEAAPAPGAAAPAATPAAPVASPAPTAAPAVDVEGNKAKALRASRRNEQRLREQLEAKDRELKELREKQGTAAPAADNAALNITDEQLAELEETYPLQAQLVRTARALQAEVEALKASRAPVAAPAAEWEPPYAPPQVQELIDQVPVLLDWQLSREHQDKFAMAQQFDESLFHDPLWKGRPAVERFNEAVRRTQEAMKLAAPPAPAASQAAAAAAIANAPVAQAAGVSDFRGGAPAAQPTRDFSRMSDAEILASLPVQP